MSYVALAAFLFLVRFATKGQPLLNLQLYPVVLIGLFLFSAFRYEVGCDWSGYYNQYLVAAAMNPEEILARREPIWWMIVYYVQLVGLDYPWVNVASSAVAFGGIHVLARRQPDPLGFLVILFPVLLINMPMSGIRQGAAIGLFCVALTRFIDGKTISYAVWVLLASGFHSSAIIFLLLAPLISSEITKLRIVLSIALAIPGIAVLFSGNAAQEASSRYINSGSEAFGAAFRLALLGISGGVFFLFLRRQWKQDFPRDYAIVTLGAFGMIGAMALLPVASVIADRVGYYLIPIQSMMFARIPWLWRLPSHDFLSAAPYLGLFVFFSVWTLSSGHFQLCYLPYQSWLFGIP